MIPSSPSGQSLNVTSHVASEARLSEPGPAAILTHTEEMAEQRLRGKGEEHGICRGWWKTWKTGVTATGSAGNSNTR